MKQCNIKNYLEKWYFISPERMIIAIKYYCYCCFTTAHQSAEYIVKLTFNWKIKATYILHVTSCILEEKFHYFLKAKYVYKKKCRKDSALLVASIVATSVYRFDMKFFRISPMASVLHVRKIGPCF